MCSIFAIGDLHLPGGDDKPMDVFGARWTGHFAKIAADWRARVADDDVVLIPGDISWAMQLDCALPDLAQIGALPGRKVLLRGNHDYWWSSITRVRASLPQGMHALQNDALALGGTVFCGSRGWTQPFAQSSDEDIRIYEREIGRMTLSLQAARKKGQDLPMVVLTHFPPVTQSGADSPMSLLFEEYGANVVVYGHLHGQALRERFEGVKNGVRYLCVSCDGLDFALRHVI